jgi:hypothetical protein
MTKGERINDETIQNILKLLNSSDEENKIVGLTLINEHYCNKYSWFYVLLLRRNSLVSTELWLKHCPKFTKYCIKKNIHNSSISFNDLWKEMLDGKEYDETDINNFIKVFSDHVNTSLKSVYDFIDDIEFKIKLKNLSNE